MKCLFLFRKGKPHRSRTCFADRTFATLKHLRPEVCRDLCKKDMQRLFIASFLTVFK